MAEGAENIRVRNAEIALSFLSRQPGAGIE
jgi:hypothetical protein